MRNDEKQSLWVEGIPGMCNIPILVLSVGQLMINLIGAGKSVLDSSLVNALDQMDGVLLYISFREGDVRTTAPAEMVASINAQVTKCGIDGERLHRLVSCVQQILPTSQMCLEKGNITIKNFVLHCSKCYKASLL